MRAREVQSCATATHLNLKEQGGDTIILKEWSATAIVQTRPNLPNSMCARSNQLVTRPNSNAETSLWRKGASRCLGVMCNAGTFLPTNDGYK